jgi:hypothetical protein
LEAQGEIIAISVLVDESEKVEIALRIAHHAFEIVDLKETQITVIILDAFLLKLRALLWCQLVRLAFALGSCRPLLMIFQERFAIVGTSAIRAAEHLHLQHAKIDSQLQFLASIQTRDLAHFDIAVLMRPIFQDGV